MYGAGFLGATPNGSEFIVAVALFLQSFNCPRTNLYRTFCADQRRQVLSINVPCGHTSPHISTLAYDRQQSESKQSSGLVKSYNARKTRCQIQVIDTRLIPYSLYLLLCRWHLQPAPLLPNRGIVPPSIVDHREA